MQLVKLALRPFRLSPLGQWMSLLALGFLIFLGTLLVSIDLGLKPIVKKLEQREVITAYLSPSISSSEERVLTDQVKMIVGAAPTVSVTQTEEFVDQLRVRHPELAEDLDTLGDELPRVVPRFVTVSGELPRDSLDKIKSIPGVEEAEVSGKRQEEGIAVFRSLRVLARVLLIGAVVAWFALVLQLTKTHQTLQRDSLRLLRYWGASAFQLRAPGLMTGVLTGLGACGVALGLWATAGSAIFSRVRNLSPLLLDLDVTVQNGLIPAVVLVGVFSGMVIGFLEVAWSDGEA